ncbi:accessory Sec system protein Asp3 [Lacticaseibacillus saniviri]
MFDLVFWPRATTASYNYGATIHFASNGAVQYSNQLMPPGEAIHTWSSVTNYDDVRTAPTLPLLQHGVTYYWESVISDLIGRIQTQVLFWDEDGAEVDRVILDEQHGTFLFPEMAKSYTIELVNIHHEQFTFDYGVLTEADTALHADWHVDLDQQSVTVVPDGQQVDTAETTVALSARNMGTQPFVLPERGAFYGIYGTTGQFMSPAWQHKQQAGVQQAIKHLSLPVMSTSPSTLALSQMLSAQ